MPLAFIFQANCHDCVTSRMEQLGYSERKWALIKMLILPEEHSWTEDTTFLLFLLGVPSQARRAMVLPVLSWSNASLRSSWQPKGSVQPHGWAGGGCGLCKGKGMFTRKMRWKSSAESGQGVLQLWFTRCSWLITPLLFFQRIHHQASGFME